MNEQYRPVDDQQYAEQQSPFVPGAIDIAKPVLDPTLPDEQKLRRIIRYYREVYQPLFARYESLKHQSDLAQASGDTASWREVWQRVLQANRTIGELMRESFGSELSPHLKARQPFNGYAFEALEALLQQPGYDGITIEQALDQWDWTDTRAVVFDLAREVGWVGRRRKLLRGRETPVTTEHLQKLEVERRALADKRMKVADTEIRSEHQ